jgi:hypothetical protein
MQLSEKYKEYREFDVSSEGPSSGITSGSGKINKRDHVTNHNKQNRMDLVKTKYKQEM